MQRIYLRDDFGDLLFIKDTSIINQISKVLRARLGDKFVFFNGSDDTDYIYEIVNADKRIIDFRFVSSEKKQVHISNVILYNAIPNKLEKIELIVQKGVEVGISKFVFFRSNRSKSLNLSDNKIDRVNKIAIEAVEQSGRNDVPEIIFIDDLDLSQVTGQNIFFHTVSDNSKKLKELSFDNRGSINLFVGPEGGWDERELSEFDQNGFTRVSLGKNILRTETVGIVSAFYIINQKDNS